MKGNERVAAVGVGYSTTGRRTGLTSWQLAIQAATAALADAGMTAQDLDGVALRWRVARPAPACLDAVAPQEPGYMLGVEAVNWYATAAPTTIPPALHAGT